MEEGAANHYFGKAGKNSCATFCAAFAIFSGPPLWSLAGTGKEARNANK
jgi:hypothetical protein